MGKKPGWNVSPSASKNPKIPDGFGTGKQVPERLPPSYGECPRWSLRRIDVDGCNGKWGWRRIPEGALWDMLSKLGHYETMTWGEIERNNKRDHSTEVHKLEKPARHRLGEIGLGDEETLFRFRLSGTVRVWGRKHGHIFEVLWYDPDHEICPSPLRNT